MQLSVLRALLLCVVMGTPLLLCGCGREVADAVLPAEEDTTLNPDTDSTMNVN
jgi:hypothetical protein